MYIILPMTLDNLVKVKMEAIDSDQRINQLTEQIGRLERTLSLLVYTTCRPFLRYAMNVLAPRGAIAAAHDEVLNLGVPPEAVAAGHRLWGSGQTTSE